MSTELILKKDHHWVIFAAFLFVLIGQTAFVYPELNNSDAVINGDGRGYYNYLSSVFIDGDIAGQTVNERFIVEYNGHGVNKYFYGTGLLMLPFFLLGMLLSWFMGVPLDGLSWPFQWSMAFAVAGYWAIGLYFLSALLRSFQLNRWLISVTVLMLTIGTNAFYYLSVDCTASHIYSFAAVAGFLWTGRVWLKYGSIKHLMLSLIILGLIISIRPVNGLIMFFIPVLADDFQVFTMRCRNLLKQPLMLILGVVSSLLLPFGQLILYKLQTGDWFIWSYTNEGFYFSSPQWLKFLFSFERGWMIYTPIFILLFPATIYLIKKTAWRGLFWLVWLVLIIYVLSSWWSWHYGGSFGSRPMIDFYACFALIISLGIQHWLADPQARNALLLGCVLSAVLNLGQVYQMHAGILSAWHMNIEKYYWSIGKYREADAHRIGGRWDTPPYHQEMKRLYDEVIRPSQQPKHWNFTSLNGDLLTLGGATAFNGTFRYQFQQINQPHVALTLELERMEGQQDAASSAYVVIEVKRLNGERYHYDAFLINDHPGSVPNEWKTWRYRYVLPKPVERGDKVLLYFWNPGGLPLELRNLKLKLDAYYVK